jgi:membrane protein
MFICPVLLIMSSSITVFITTQITQITEKIDLLGAVSPLISLLLKLLPLCVIWMLFTFLYIFMPNTKVRIGAGILGGVTAGLTYQIVQWAYITFQIGVSRYGAIYGSFAALPLFMIWLQLSWLIVLMGAEISFAYQNVETYEFEPDSLNAKPSFRRLLALRMVQMCVRDFTSGRRPPDAEQISHSLGVPIRLTNLLLSQLVECRILSEVRETDNSEPLYQPALNVDEISVIYVLRALDNLGTDTIPLAESQELESLSESLRQIEEMVEKSSANLLLKDV